MATDAEMVRLLLCDVDPASQVFTEQQIGMFLAMEGGAVKLAAAQAIDTNASNEVLASKVLSSQDVRTDGAKAADALRKHAQALRDQHYADLAKADESTGGGAYTVPEGCGTWPEAATRPCDPYRWPY